MTRPGWQRRAHRSHAPDGATQHRDWLQLIEVSGPFLSLPVLRSAWPTLDALEKPTRDALRHHHAVWQDDPANGQRAWVDWVLADMLGWGTDLRTDGGELDALSMHVGEHDTRIVPSFALVDRGEDVKPATTRLVGMLCPPGQHPTARLAGSTWAATPADRLATLCRHHGVELGLVTDGRWWALVWAARDKATSTAVFDAVAWNDAAERDVVRAFVSLLSRQRFFGVPDEEKLPALLHASLDSQEEITEALGTQVREAVELLVAAFGREDTAARQRGDIGLEHVDAHEVYRGAVSVMMRIVFLLFAEERRLLPADNELYASTYSAGRLCAELERRAHEGSEDDLEYTSVGWHRLLALFSAVYGGIEHPRLTTHAHDGSLFDPDQFPWLDLPIDDRTVLHMLRAVQYVEIGAGRSRERRTLSFRSLDVEQIGYVYEGLLSYDGFRATDVVLGLVGKRGQEVEVELRELESIAARCRDVPELAAAIATQFKDSGIGSAKAVEKRLAVRRGAEAEDARRKLLAVVRGDYRLAERLEVFYGLLRRDLRDLPLVILPGALYVTDSPLRRNTGTHYTPKELAEEVVHHALEPLVYEPGPLQTADTAEWRLKSSAEILALNVADIAMGSAAFLVAAARYLGARLIEAWTREGDTRAQAYSLQDVRSDEDPVVVDARRQVIEHCLYGVDINPMAVEMAKLSLWLVSMDPTRPFTFLDDRLVCGDSLLGITSLEQLEYMHLDPAEGRKLHTDLFGWTNSVRSLVADVAKEREELVNVPVEDRPMERLAEKRARLYEAWSKVNHLMLFADLLVGASLASQRKNASSRGPHLREAGASEDQLGRDALLVDAARLANDVAEGRGERKAREAAARWLGTDLALGALHRQSLHWPLVLPEVFERGGFDALIGNPPFLGGKKISGAVGGAYREYLVQEIAGGMKGNADLVAYFLLRAHTVLSSTGQLGLVATNTLAQGDTREVGLDRLQGSTIRRSVKSRKWPSATAALEYCVVWISKSKPERDAALVRDGDAVFGIGPSLDALSRVHGAPRVLAKNTSSVFQGSNVVGSGFILGQDEVASLISSDPGVRDVIRPFLTGQDLNTRPDQSPSRWIIDFGDRGIEAAAGFSAPFQIVRTRVKPQREKLPDYKKRVRENWWKFEHQAKSLYRSIDGMRCVLAMAIVSRTVMPAIVATGKVFSHKVVVFASSDPALMAFLSSGVHYWWTARHTSTMKTDINYSPSDVFETLPLPTLTRDMRLLGRRLDVYRRRVMMARRSGLTKTYNLVFDPACVDEDIEELRRIHREIDEATIRAYGWEDRLAAGGGLDHGFHPVGRDTRYTIGPAAQREVLDSLLELNHERYAEEVAQGLHDKKKGSRAKAKKPDQEAMFDAD